MAQETKKNKASGVVVSIIIIAVIVLLILGISLLPKKGEGGRNASGEESPLDESGTVETSVDEEIAGGTTTAEQKEYTVEIALQGFVPKTLAIKKGDKVTWVNKMATKSRPAGDVHPTHTNYPGSSIIKCGTAEEKNIFDACREIGYGETYSFVFNEAGEWGYHDHLQPSNDGKIIVTE